MSDRDRQNPYDRNTQQGSGRYGQNYDSPRQANQWQSDSSQQGGDWQQDSSQRAHGSEDYSHDYRFSGQNSGQGSSYDYDRGGSQGYGRSGSGSYGQSSNYGQGGYTARQDEGRYGAYDRGSSDRGFGDNRGQRGYGQYENRGDRNRYGAGGSASAYAGRDYDASGGNDFGNFTSEDFGGRDFSNRGGSGLSGGARSSESYRPSYGPGSWGRDDNDSRSDRNRNTSREDYGSWRHYGESRGFLQRAGDEIASWFGDEDASRRREQDQRYDDRQEQLGHRGRGPSGYTRSDDRIREDANDRLTHDHRVDATDITVSVKDGEVTLDGKVDSRDAKRRAEDAVEHISGVKHVQNNLRVQERQGSTGYGASSGTNSWNTGSTTGAATPGSSSTSALSGTGSTASSSALGSASTGTSGTATTGASTTSGIGSASTTRTTDKTS